MNVAERILSVAESSGGLISWSDFIRECLYSFPYGYYVKDARRVGKEGAEGPDLDAGMIEGERDAEGLRIMRLLLATDVVRRLPVDARDVFTLEDGSIFCYVEISAPKEEPRAITLRFTHATGLTQSYELPINQSPAWRTWSKLNLTRSMTGRWSCEIFNEDGVRTQRYYETLMLPMEVIGSRENAVKASIDELYIYDRILNENEIIRLSGAQIPINVALNKEVTVGNYHSASTEADRSGAKAVDGDLTSRWEFDLYNTDTNYIQIPLNADESVEKVVIRQMVWGGVNRITKIRITAVNDGAETEILPETAYDGGEIDSANQIAVKEIDLGQSVKADAVKIYLTPKAAGPDDLVNIRELELYGTISAEEPEPVSKSILERYLNDAKDWVEKGEVDSCVESIRKLFDEAIAEGEAVMADADATRDEVVDAARKLMLAINALNMKAADLTDDKLVREIFGFAYKRYPDDSGYFFRASVTGSPVRIP